MSEQVNKLYTGILQFSILTFSLALVWFAFIHYPKLINEYKRGNFTLTYNFQPVAAQIKNFPIETAVYKITFEQKSGTYYVFVQGKTLAEFVFNRSNAKLALKNALDANNLCEISIIYSSTSSLKVPQKYQQNTDCQ